MKLRFTITEVEENIVNPQGEDNADVEYDASPPVEVDLEGALKSLDSDTWDNIEHHGNSIDCYPADSHMNMRTGYWEQTQVHIGGKERHLEWLLKLWRAQQDARRKRYNRGR